MSRREYSISDVFTQFCCKLLIQRFIVLLFSPRGADFRNLLPKSGTLNPLTRSLVLSRASLGVGLAATLLKRSTPNTAPLDEVLQQASVDGVTMDAAAQRIDVVVTLRSAAGVKGRVPINVGLGS